MEPPAKRLRILQSVEVDEQDPDYILAKQKQQQKFKGRLESIFAKFEVMHESMSDEIDMRDNRVVVDRGHLRRLERQVGRKETLLLDTLGIAAKQDPEHSLEQDKGSEDSEDELAPTQPPKPSKRHSGDGNGEKQTALPHPDTIANAAPQPSVPLPDTPNPAANLLHLVQFPQTPAGQQAQATFYTTLAQTINQAVQQAVAPLFSSILPITQNTLPPYTSPLSAPTTPAQIDDKIAPATDPKWFFPPLSTEKGTLQAVHSSPLIALGGKKTSDNVAACTKDIETRVICQDKTPTETRVTKDASVSVSPVQTEIRVNPVSRRRSPRVEIYKKSKGPLRKYNFTKEDDIYISRKKELHKLGWSEIRASRERWREWPLATFQKHWSQHLKNKKLHLTKPPTILQDDAEHPNPEVTYDDMPLSPVQSHHLPTPSSLEHDDSSKEAEDYNAEYYDHVISSSADFDDDERELLSLVGFDADSEQHHVNDDAVNDYETTSLAPEDIILPSVEMEEFTDQVILPEKPLEISPVEEAIPCANRIKAGPSVSMPTSERAQKFKPTSFQTEPDSKDENDIDIDCSEKAAHKHQTTQRQQSGSIDLVGDDEIQAATIPYIKREFSTPPPTTFLFSTPAIHTPTSFPQRSSAPSSDSKSTSKAGRKAFLKQVKQSWTKKSASTSGRKTLAKRKSFPSVPMKRAWIQHPESEDELA